MVAQGDVSVLARSDINMKINDIIGQPTAENVMEWCKALIYIFFMCEFAFGPFQMRLTVVQAGRRVHAW